MNSLWLLTKKNLKLLIRAKGSALIVVFAPLLIILILGLSFNNNSKYGLNIGIYSPNFNEDTNSFINTLQEQEFKIIKYIDNATCIEEVKLGYVHTCITLPDSFKIEGNTAKEITFYIDPSKINLVWMIQQTLESKFNLKEQEITQNLAQDMLTRMSEANTKVSTEKSNLKTVGDKSSSAASSADSTKSTLSGLDLIAPDVNYDLSVLTSFQTSLTSSLTTSTAKINSAKTALNNANISSSARTPIITLLNEAGTSVSSAASVLTSTSGNGTLAAVSAMVTGMQTDLTSAKTKLSTASLQVSASTKNLDQIKKSLNEGISSLESIQKGLDEVSSKLSSQKVTDAKVASNPLITKIEKISPENTYLNYMFSGLIILVIMFTSLLLGTTLVMMEKTSPAFTRNFFLPIKKITFVLSTYLTNLILILIQVIIILGIAIFFLKEGIYASLLPLALILFLVASVFTFLGMIIGYILSSEETAVLASISLGSLLLFFSGLILPLESVSSTVRDITFFNPFVLGEKLVRETILFATPLSSLWMDLVVLFGYALVLFLIILIIESLMHQHIVNKLFHHHHAQREKDKLDKKDI
ncbi:MAG: ABC transporter permease [Candidatus Woesearchaeota archaeon]|jgi:ABC-type multidrug transport system permease subunit